jgi:hypothetical protein
MFYEQRTDRSDTTSADLGAEYETDLRTAIEDVGIDRAIAETDVDRGTLVALLEGSLPALTLSEAAAIQSLATETPDADEIADLACDHLLLGMSNAIMDVDALDRRLELDLGPKAIQRKLERRDPMTFEEFVRFQAAIAAEES